MKKSLKTKIYQRLQSIIFAIHPKLLGDNNTLAWTNLGLWSSPNDDYITAAKRLAQSIGQSLGLNTQDQLLDIGCGHGASLQYWHQQFAIQHITAIELQKKCCDKIQSQYLPYLKQIFNQSLFDPNLNIHLNSYDVMISLDATYHYALTDYLQAILPYLKPNGRIGFHFLLKSNGFHDLSLQQQKHIQRQLAWAKIDIQQLCNKAHIQTILANHHFKNIEIIDLTEQVFKGFADYFFAKNFYWQQRFSLDYLKIKMTAQLCANLIKHGQIRYVQITAQKTN